MAPSGRANRPRGNGRERPHPGSGRGRPDRTRGGGSFSRCGLVGRQPSARNVRAAHRSRHADHRGRRARRRIAHRSRARRRRDPQRAQSALHGLAEIRDTLCGGGDRGGARIGRHPDVPRQRLQLWLAHSAGARRGDTDASAHPQGPAAPRDRAAHAGRGARRRACHRGAGGRLFRRRRAGLMVRPGGRQGNRGRHRHLSGGARRAA